MGGGLAQFYKKTVAAGAQLVTDVVDTKGCDMLAVLAYNADGAAARNLTLDFMDDDKTTVIYSVTVSIPASGKQGFAVGQGAAAGTGITPISFPTPGYVRATLAAAGSSAGTVSIWGR
jgi:hypothetical protein